MNILSEEEIKKTKKYIENTKMISHFHKLLNKHKKMSLDEINSLIDIYLKKIDKDKVTPPEFLPLPPQLPIESLYAQYVRNRLNFLAAELNVSKSKKRQIEVKPVLLYSNLNIKLIKEIDEYKNHVNNLKKLENKLFHPKTSKFIDEFIKLNIKFTFATESDSHGEIYKKSLLLESIMGYNISEEFNIFDISEYLLSNNPKKSLLKFQNRKIKNKEEVFDWITTSTENFSDKDYQTFISNLYKIMNLIKSIPVDHLYNIVKHNSRLQGKTFKNGEYHNFID